MEEDFEDYDFIDDLEDLFDGDIDCTFGEE